MKKILSILAASAVAIFTIDMIATDTRRKKVTDALANQNVAALLMVIRYAEHDDRIAANASVYQALYSDTFANRKTFSNFAEHPYISGEWAGVPLPANYCIAAGFSNGICKTTAAGAYALELIREHDALELIKCGCFVEAIHRINDVWASLPGHDEGQPEVSLAALLAVYENYGGTLG